MVNRIFTRTNTLLSLRIIGVLFGYINAIVLANGLTIDHMADYGSAIFLISIAVLFADLGCSGIIVREAPSITNRTERSTLFFSLMKKISTSSAVIIVIGLLVYLTNSESITILIAITVATWSFSKYTAEATKGTLMPVHATIANSVIPQLGFFALILLVPLSLFNAILCLAASRLMSFIYGYIVLTTTKISTLRDIRHSNYRTPHRKAHALSHSTYMLYGAALALIPQIFIPIANFTDHERFAAWLVLGLKVSILYKTAHQSILTQYLPKMLKFIDEKDKAKLELTSKEASRQLRLYGIASFALSIAYSIFLEYTLSSEYNGISYLIIPVAFGYLISSALGPRQYLQAFLSNSDRAIGVIIVLTLCGIGFMALTLNTSHSLSTICFAVITCIVIKAALFHHLSSKKLDSIFDSH